LSGGLYCRGPPGPGGEVTLNEVVRGGGEEGSKNGMHLNGRWHPDGLKGGGGGGRVGPQVSNKGVVKTEGGKGIAH